jgi:hypothetical protein
LQQTPSLCRPIINHNDGFSQTVNDSTMSETQ